MTAQRTAKPAGLGLRLFNTTLTVLTLVLVAASLAALPLVLLILTGRDPVAVPAELDRPYRISFLDPQERSIVVASDFRINGYHNFESGEEFRYLRRAPDVRMGVRIDRTDSDSRGVIAAYAVVALLLAWTVVWNLRGIVRSAKEGDPFVPANVVRLRRLAAAVLAFPLLQLSSKTILARTLETDPRVTVAGPGVGLWILVVVGLAVLALAEVFRSGSDLRQFEQETV